MIKFENVVTPSPEQWKAVIFGMRNPYNSWDKSDSGFGCDYSDQHFCTICEGGHTEACPNSFKQYKLGPNDLDLMNRLRNSGTDHRKFMRMLPVMVTITAPLYWWKEFDTYKIATVSNSCSTMHKIHAKEFTLEDFSTDRLIDYELYSCDEVDGPVLNCAPDVYCGGLQHMNLTINVLNYYRKKYLETKDKKYWWQMIQLLPSSYNQKRTIMMNFEVLANIYKSRKDHRLNEWRELCDWIKTLPYSELITGDRNENLWIPCTDENAKMPEEGEKVLCTLKEDWSYGDEKDVQYHVFEGEYKTIKEDCYDMPAANGKGYFEAIKTRRYGAL